MKCPDIEQVSAYFDGELDPASVEAAHISSCCECRKYLKAYEALNSQLKGELAGAVDENLSDTILMRVRKNTAKKADISVFPFFAKAAGILLALGLFALYTGKLARNSSESGAADPGMEMAGGENLESSNASEIARDRRFPSSSGNIAYSDISGASTSSPAFTAVVFGSGDKKKMPVAIAADVRHVWLVRDLEEAGELIGGILQKASDSEASRVETGRGTVSYEVEIDKRSLVDVVRSFAAAGPKLLSPSAPQPEQSLFSGNGEDKVIYRAELLEDEDSGPGS